MRRPMAPKGPGCGKQAEISRFIGHFFRMLKAKRVADLKSAPGSG